MLNIINDLLWSKMLILMLIGLGLYFTIASRCVQLRYFTRMFAMLGESFQRQPGQLSSFQALMLSIAGRVGAGNIAGVSVAIMLGGPGAVFCGSMGSMGSETLIHGINGVRDIDPNIDPLKSITLTPLMLTPLMPLMAG